MSCLLVARLTLIPLQSYGIHDKVLLYCYIYFIIPNIILSFFLPFFPLAMVFEVPRTARWAFAMNG